MAFLHQLQEDVGRCFSRNHEQVFPGFGAKDDAGAFKSRVYVPSDRLFDNLHPVIIVRKNLIRQDGSYLRQNGLVLWRERRRLTGSALEPRPSRPPFVAIPRAARPGALAFKNLPVDLSGDRRGVPHVERGDRVFCASAPTRLGARPPPSH